MFARRHWFPPLGLLTGHLAHGAAWAFLFVLAAQAGSGVTLDALAWVHLVALGWLTLIALSVLLHVIPAFTGNQWRGEGFARGALVSYTLGAAGLIASFAGHAVSLLSIFGALVAASLLVYLICAFATLFVPPPQERTERAIARALATTLVFLAVTVAFGVGLTVMIRTSPLVAWVVALVHADLGLLGWLSLLVVGVSTRTLRVITGNDVRVPWLHIAVGAGLVIGVLVSATGLALGIAPLIDAGAIVLALAGVLYLAQLGLLLAGARNPHRPPQFFAFASGTWLLVAGGLGIGVLAGRPYGAAFVFVMLTGWLGQMVNAHLHHIGIRLLATVARGDEDETQPIELLDPRLSWAAFAAFQMAVFAGLWTAVTGSDSSGWIAAACGVAGWFAMTANVAIAWRNARRPAALISLL